MPSYALRRRMPARPVGVRFLSFRPVTPLEHKLFSTTYTPLSVFSFSFVRTVSLVVTFIRMFQAVFYIILQRNLSLLTFFCLFGLFLFASTFFSYTEVNMM